ncbi:protein phosphatase CheZ [Thiomicrorhabdus arctica]|uniref:protein phosphatase CheZ n=1 Tax=Thiomicrorhabdus arctica TaxID=131540 RepID=UPI00036F7643|nr:protein phosphatase CheZ [Thiomicrorhabdus arctica]
MTFPTQIDQNLVKALLKALESGEPSQAGALLDELTQVRESELYQRVSELTQNLHQTLDGLNDSTLLLQTKHDIPDAAERLEYVINMTAEASNKTLESAENALSLMSSLQEITCNSIAGSDTEILLKTINKVNSELTEIMLAQSFQDLTGQVLNRVIMIITSLEQSLIHLIDQSTHDYASIPDREESAEDKTSDEMKGVGPNVTAKSKNGSTQSQAEVDDLLSDLGF